MSQKIKTILPLFCVAFGLFYFERQYRLMQESRLAELTNKVAALEAQLQLRSVQVGSFYTVTAELIF